MSTYKHTPTTDALDTLGSIISENEKRDAIHLGVEPVIAGEKLHPGDHVSLKDGIAKRTLPTCGVGIVDPFLPKGPEEGQRFWLVVYPRQITSLRHVWEHPSFPASQEIQFKIEESPMSESEKWIRDFASNLGVKYDELLNRAEDYQVNGEYWNQGERFEGEWIPEEFWDHYKEVTGKEVKDRYSFLSCSC